MSHLLAGLGHHEITSDVCLFAPFDRESGQGRPTESCGNPLPWRLVIRSMSMEPNHSHHTLLYKWFSACKSRPLWAPNNPSSGPAYRAPQHEGQC